MTPRAARDLVVSIALYAASAAGSASAIATATQQGHPRAAVVFAALALGWLVLLVRAAKRLRRWIDDVTVPVYIVAPVVAALMEHPEDHAHITLATLGGHLSTTTVLHTTVAHEEGGCDE